MPRPGGRFTVRRLMLAVAIVAVAFAALVEVPRLWTLRQQHLRRAEQYGYWEERINGAVGIRQEITYYSIHQPRGPEPSPERLERMKVEASYYGGLRAKYQRAAQSPWLSLAPDPSPP